MVIISADGVVRSKPSTGRCYLTIGFVLLLIVICQLRHESLCDPKNIPSESGPAATEPPTTAPPAPAPTPLPTEMSREEPKSQPKKRILLTYNGPMGIGFKRTLYVLNTNFFLEHGLKNCDRHDTILFVGYEAYDEYYFKAQQHPCDITVVARRNICYDMESVHLVFKGGVAGIHIEDYDYFVYLNSGVTGPHPLSSETWLDTLLDPLGKNNKVAMTGLSIACEGFHKDLVQIVPAPHVQSMVYALDRNGLDIVIKNDCAFDCTARVAGQLDTDYGQRFQHIVRAYEMKMTSVLLDAGYGVALPFLPADNPNLVTLLLAKNRTKCFQKDLWYTDHLNQLFNTSTPASIKDIVFWKSSRVFSYEVQNLVNFTGKVQWKQYRRPG